MDYSNLRFPKPLRCDLRGQQRKQDKINSRLYLAAHPLCEKFCGRRATGVHHTKPKRMGGSRLPSSRSRENMQALCTDCHEKEHGL